MKNRYFNYKGALFSIAAASVIFSGCGSNDIDDVYALPEKTTSTYTIKVVDDAVKTATLAANECNSYEELGDGYYKMSGCYSRPKAIISSGGYFEDEDGNKTQMDFPLILNTEMFEGEDFVVTPLTTLLSTVDDYAQLETLKTILGFENIQDMFKDTSDDENKTALQQQINGFFINAKNSGLDLNKFDLLSEQLRDNIIAKKDEANPLAIIQAAQKKFKDDFEDPVKRAQLIDSYGIVFSGFVTQTNYNESNPKSFLKNISEKYQSNENSLVFSGFVYDDIIGASNPDNKYDTNATVKLIDLNTTNEIFSIEANDYGSWNIKDVNISTIVNDNLYSFESSIHSLDKNGTIVLKSLLKGSEILDKYKSKVNTSDLPDLTISNVTTAKYACWDKKKASISDILEFKKDFEQSDDILDLSGFIKSMVDGTSTFSGTDSYTYLLSKMDNNCNLTATNVSDLETMKTKTKSDTTLKQQFESTVVLDFVLTEAMFKNISIAYKNLITNKKYQLLLFENNTIKIYGDKSYDVGQWSLTDNKLTLNLNGQVNDITISFSGEVQEDTQTQASFKNGQFNFTEGLKARILETNQLLDIANVTKIDLTQQQAPLVKFDQAALVNKTFYEVYQDTNGEYQDRFIKLLSANSAKVNESVGSTQLQNATDTTWSVTNGVLTIGTDTYNVVSSSDTKIVCLKNNTETMELFYNSLNAAAAKELNKYQNSDYVNSVTLGEFSSSQNNDEFNSYETITQDGVSKLKLTTKALNNNLENYAYSYVWADKSVASQKNIGTQVKLAQTFNIGNSDNQSSGYVVKYNLPSCNTSNSEGELQVVVKITGDKVAYNLKLKQSDGTIKNIFDNPVTIIEESTLGKEYDTMVLYLENKLMVRVSDGQNSYYQTTDFVSLRDDKSTLLGYYKYPNQLKDIRIFNNLNKNRYADGTSIYKENRNNKVELEVSSVDLIDGKEEINYIDTEPTTCNTGITNSTDDSNSDDTPTTENTVFSGYTWEKVTADSRYTVEGNIAELTSTKATLTTVKNDNQNSRTEIKTLFGTNKSKASATVKLLETSTEYNRVTFRTVSDITVSNDVKNSLNLSSNDISVITVISVKGKQLFAYSEAYDNQDNEVTIFNQELYYDNSNSVFVNNPVTLSIESIGDSIVFSASASGLTIAPVSFKLPEGTTYNGMKGSKIRTEIKDDMANSDGNEAGTTVKAEVYNLSTVDFIDPNTPYIGELVYSNMNFLKIVDINHTEFSAKIMEDEDSTTPYTYISNLPITLYSLEKHHMDGVLVEMMDKSNNTLKFVDVNDTNHTNTIGNYTVSTDGKMIFSDREIRYAGSFDSNTLNTTNHEVFGNSGKTHVMIEKFSSDTIEIFNDINYTNGFTSLEEYKAAHSDHYSYMYETAPNQGIAFGYDTNSSYITQELDTFENINETQFDNLAANDPTVLDGITLYNLEYEQEWDENTSSEVYGSFIESISFSPTKFKGTVLETIRDDLNETWEDNITITNNIIVENNNTFRIKFVDIIDANITNAQLGEQVFTFGKAYKMAFFRDKDEFEWDSENDINSTWNYPRDMNTTNHFTTLESFMEYTHLSGEALECNGNYMPGDPNWKCYVFSVDSNLSNNSGNLVDRDDLNTTIGTWEYTNNIITTNITNTDYLWNGDLDTPALRIDPSNGYVQRINYEAAGTGEEFYLYDEVAKNEWKDFFNNNQNTGKLQLVDVDMMGVVNSNVGTWERKTINGLDSILLHISPQYNLHNETPVKVLSDGVVKEGEFKKQGDVYKHYLFDETSKNEWLNYINSN